MWEEIDNLYFNEVDDLYCSICGGIPDVRERWIITSDLKEKYGEAVCSVCGEEFYVRIYEGKTNLIRRQHE